MQPLLETRGGINPCSTQGSGMPTADLFTMAELFSVPHCSPMTELSLFTHTHGLSSCGWWTVLGFRIWAQVSYSGQNSGGLLPRLRRGVKSNRVPHGAPPGCGDNVCAPSCPLQDVMMVGEPTLMGGEFGDEDERLITRLENTQFDAANGIDDEDSFNSSPALGTNSPWNSKAPSSQESKNDNPTSQSSQ